MSTAKEIVKEVLDTQPDDASYDEIVKALSFDRMISRGLEDSRGNRVIEDKDLARRIKLWRG